MIVDYNGGNLRNRVLLVCLITVAYKFDQRILNAQGSLPHMHSGCIT